MKKLAQVKLTISVFKQGNQYVVYSPALDLSTAGASEAEAKRRFAEAAMLFLEELDQAGTMSNVLRELGWEDHGAQWTPPPVSEEAINVRLPVAA